MPDAKHEWVIRVLGLQPPPSPAGHSFVAPATQNDPAAPPGPAMAVWNDAKDAVDIRLNALFDVLRKIGLPELAQAADAIGSVLEGYRTGLTKALMDFDAAPAGGREKARLAALAVIEEYRARLPADRHVIAADSNPFDIPIDARATLGAALDQLHRRLAER